MFRIRKGKFEMGIDLDHVSAEHLFDLFRELKECPQCGEYPDTLQEMEHEVWREYLRRSCA